MFSFKKKNKKENATKDDKSKQTSPTITKQTSEKLPITTSPVMEKKPSEKLPMTTSPVMEKKPSEELPLIEKQTSVPAFEKATSYSNVSEANQYINEIGESLSVFNDEFPDTSDENELREQLRKLKGRKLEARDLKYPTLICCATIIDINVNDVQKPRVKIHFDGWENTYDYWTFLYNPSLKKKA